MMAVIIVGLLCLAVAFVRLPLARWDAYLPILGILTILVGSRVTIPIPRFKSHIAVSDTFIFLTLLLYGGEFAVILSAVEAFVSSWRFCNRKLTVFFNAAVVAVSTSMVVAVLQMTGLYSEKILRGHSGVVANLVMALSLTALTQFAVNTWLAAIYDALKNALPLWETWKSKYIWTFGSYFVGAIGAGVLIKLTDAIGIGVIFASFPVIVLLYLTYRMYMQNLEMSIEQKERAEENAKVVAGHADALRESEERFRSAFDYAPIGMALVGDNDEWIKVNRAMCEIFGYSESELVGQKYHSMLVDEDRARVESQLKDLREGRVTSCQSELCFENRSDRTVWTWWSASAANVNSAGDQRLIFQIQDISGKKTAEEKLQHDATHDSLTSLPNRSYFMSRLSSALERRYASDDYRVSILFIDLDRFKYVNDSLGHLAGDKLLKMIAERLRESMRPTDLVARLGGDEFTILVEGSYDESEVIHIAERINQKFSVPFELDGNEIYSSASIGILHASPNHRTSEDMMRDADTAMYHAKKSGKARHEIFDEIMFKEARDTLRIETELRRAVERKDISVYYQPICSLETGRISGVEALARWHHRDLGDLSPSRFIAVAEEIGLIDKLSEHVLTTACREISSLADEPAIGPLPALSVNLSCKQFGQATLVQGIERILAETRFPPEMLRLEITESVFVEHPARGIEMLRQLREFGIEIHIDDFGTGYSNLSFLVKLPISTLKIDRSFIGMIENRSGNDEIIRAIITLAHSLNLKVIAEGIETEAQLNVLERLGCEGGQGYYFAAPMSFDALRSFLAEQNGVSFAGRGFGTVASVSTIQ